MKRAPVLCILCLSILLTVSCATAADPQGEIENAALLLCSTYVDAGDYRAAADVCADALTRISSSRLQYNLAVCLAMAEDWDAAEEAALQGQRDWPDTLSFIKLRIRFFTMREMYSEVLEVSLEGLEADPWCESFGQSALEAYLMLGMADQAKALARTLIGRDICLESARKVLLTGEL